MPHVSSRGAEIYYEVHGEGPVLVFAHGMGGNHLSWWQQVPSFVGRGYRVVSFDHRGFGRSSCAPDDFHPLHFPDDLFATWRSASLAPRSSTSRVSATRRISRTPPASTGSSPTSSPGTSRHSRRRR